MKKFLRSRIFSFILGVVVTSGITTVLAFSFLASDVGYTPADSTWKKQAGGDITNVSEAIDELRSSQKKYDNLPLVLVSHKGAKAEFALNGAFTTLYKYIKIEFVTSGCTATLWSVKKSKEVTITLNQKYLINSQDDENEFTSLISTPNSINTCYTSFRLSRS